MKRKRGHKKGKSKRPSKVAKTEEIPVVSIDNTEDDSNNVDEDINDEIESAMEVGTPSSTGTDQPSNVASIKPDGSLDKGLGKPVGRVKVKLKTPKLLESSHSDTDKNSSQRGFERQGGSSDRFEDSAISLAQMKMNVLGNASKKAGSIKIKASSVLGSSSVSKTNASVAAQSESSYRKHLKTPRIDHRYNKEELDAALTVIKKVMKLDAAEPFNFPVNPEALGIPDYFDVIDTPMDFGTICSNLENRGKYLNSEDVYKDVKFIWENCNKYNNKGDYILDLMKRVKKNFMKLWMSAGLYIEQSSGSAGLEGIQDIAQSSQGKSQVKGGQKQKSGKRHGRRHKHDCLCAICVLKRRKREREENARIAEGQIGGVEGQALTQEESSPVESPHGDDSSSDMGDSQDLDADVEVEGKREEAKMENAKPHYTNMEVNYVEEEEEDNEEEDEEDEEVEGGEEENEIGAEKKDEGSSLGEESVRRSEPGRPQNSDEIQVLSVEHEEEAVSVQKQARMQKKSQEWAEKAKLYSDFDSKNPTLFSLCETLFPKDHKSVWSGPHSLVPRQVSSHSNSILAAVESFMR